MIALGEQILMSDYEQFYRACLDRARTSGGQMYARCPWHEDVRESLSIKLSTGQWMCHACDIKGNAITFARRLGISPPFSQSFSTPLRIEVHAPTSQKETAHKKAKADRGEQQSRIVATYDYHDENGSLLYQVVRFEPKGFAQRVKKDERWQWGVPSDVPRVPYHLPKLIQSDSTVFLVEGEKDVHKLESLHLVATTTPMGANNWSASFARYFRGRNVCVLPDNDPQGNRYGRNAAKDIKLEGGKVKVVRLAGLPDKGDVSDYLDNPQHSRDTLLDLVRTAPVFGTVQFNNEKASDYFAKRNIHVHDGMLLLEEEYRPVSDENVRTVLNFCGATNDMASKKAQECEALAENLRTKDQFARHLRALKEMHEASWVEH